MNDAFWSAFEPVPDIGLAEYSIRNIFNEFGRPFDYLAFPHMVAPGGPMDAFDSLTIREIVMQWASRLGKTFIVLCGTVYLADLAPCEMILAGNDENLGLQQTRRVRDMARQIPSLASQTLERSQIKHLKWAGNVIHAAWAKSPLTLSNINAMYGACSELDLFQWPTTSKHPHPAEMFMDRFKDNDTTRKMIWESIPTFSGTYVDRNEQERPHSQIEAKRLSGLDCSFWVGCVHCGGRQVLERDRISEGGYSCEHCDRLVEDQDKKRFIRSGVWVPRGCTPDPDKAQAAADTRLKNLESASELPEGPELDECRSRLAWSGWGDCDYLIGRPDNDGTIASYQLSSFYALSLSWKSMDQQCGQAPYSQNIVNQWFGKTFEINDEAINLEIDARDLAERITGELDQGNVPEWCEYVILIVDRQMRVFPWQVQAWSADLDKFCIIDAGRCLSFEELDLIADRKHGGRRYAVVLADSGYSPHEIYEWCLKISREKKIKAYPVKGEKSSVVVHDYKLFEVDDEQGRKSRYVSIRRMHVNTQSTQEWINRILESGEQVRLWKADQQGMCEELLNDCEHIKESSRVWKRVDSTKPNDQRDNARYGYCGAQQAKALFGKRKPPAAPTGETKPGFIRKRKGKFIRGN